jgi:hypothetical protein
MGVARLPEPDGRLIDFVLVPDATLWTPEHAEFDPSRVDVQDSFCGARVSAEDRSLEQARCEQELAGSLACALDREEEQFAGCSWPNLGSSVAWQLKAWRQNPEQTRRLDVIVVSRRYDNFNGLAHPRQQLLQRLLEGHHASSVVRASRQGTCFG